MLRKGVTSVCSRPVVVPDELVAEVRGIGYWTSVEIAVPRQSQRLPGISMAGFGRRVPALADIAMVAHPSVTLFVDLSEGAGLVPGVPGVHGRSGRTAPGDLCLQIRLSPVVAAALLGASTELVGTVKAFTGVTPTALAAAPWLSIDDVAWPTPFAVSRAGIRS